MIILAKINSRVNLFFLFFHTAASSSEISSLFPSFVTVIPRLYSPCAAEASVLSCSSAAADVLSPCSFVTDALPHPPCFQRFRNDNIF